MSGDLIAVCDICLGGIADGDGVSEVDTAAADRALCAWRTRVGAELDAVWGGRGGV